MAEIWLGIICRLHFLLQGWLNCGCIMSISNLVFYNKMYVSIYRYPMWMQSMQTKKVPRT